MCVFEMYGRRSRIRSNERLDWKVKQRSNIGSTTGSSGYQRLTPTLLSIGNQSIYTSTRLGPRQNITCRFWYCMHICIHAKAYACTGMDMHAHAYKCMHMHAYACTCMPMPACACTCMHMRAYACICMYMHAYEWLRMHMIYPGQTIIILCTLYQMFVYTTIPPICYNKN